MPRTSVQEVAPLSAKKPASVKDVVIDWSEWLVGSSITAASFLADDGITVSDRGFTPETHRLRLEGGEHGRTYMITSLITNIDGEEESVVMRQAVREVR